MDQSRAVRRSPGACPRTWTGFEKSGYTGYLRKNAKDTEAGGDHYGAAVVYAMLGENDAAFAALEKAVAAGNHVDTSNLTRDSIISAPTRVIPTCCVGWGCRSKRPDIPILKEDGAWYAKQSCLVRCCLPMVYENRR